MRKHLPPRKDEKMDLHKFAPCKYVANIQILRGKYMANMINATFAQLFTAPVFLVYKCGIHHLCHIFTPQYFHTCDIFARSEFVQIHFFFQWDAPLKRLNKHSKHIIVCNNFVGVKKKKNLYFSLCIAVCLFNDENYCKSPLKQLISN